MGKKLLLLSGKYESVLLLSGKYESGDNTTSTNGELQNTCIKKLCYAQSRLKGSHDNGYGVKCA